MKHLESEAQLQEILQNGKTILMFSADWCPDCRIIEPELPAIEAKYKEYEFIYVDRDQFIDVCQQYDVFGIPSFIAFSENKETGRFVSKDRKTTAEIESFIESLPQ
ncbi:Thiol-disulfide isomerase or thioredoxin [Terribacillus aidingensis]|uniref:Thiol-disulfide isomerase or thioredoxin n=1 Tax=Terribacillus aidingensis TaxID=586416 RepID=A0A285P9M1_9BACI|nr:thioredoxin family protein [Terribacillus aidingensis]SNZ18128.1 Thiol-disulfide isomerase or thioredoxin [Terribacillus aidingensis]